MKVVFCCPFLLRPTGHFIRSLEASVPFIERAGWEHGLAQERGNPYISAARATLLRKALDAKADVIVFLDYDLSWRPLDLVTLIETPGDVVAGTYRYKKSDVEEYMGGWFTTPEGKPVMREDGRIKASRVPGGFLKVTKEAVDKFMTAYPHLCYGPKYHLSVDLFNHGAHNGAWWGEDMAFSRNWIDAGGDIWLVQDMQLDHHSETESFPGNLHQFLMRCPGGVNDPARLAAE